MGSETWSLTAKICDSCKTTPSVLYSDADSAYLCSSCYSKIHAANKLASRHARMWICEVCDQAPAVVTCKADDASLCITCDRDIHSANPLACRHERLPVVPFYDVASATKSPPSSAAEEYSEEEAEAASWLLPDPNSRADDESGSPEYKSAGHLFLNMDPYLDVDLMVHEQKQAVFNDQKVFHLTEWCPSRLINMDRVIFRVWLLMQPLQLTKWIIQDQSPSCTTSLHNPSAKVYHLRPWTWEWCQTIIQWLMYPTTLLRWNPFPLRS